MNRKTASCSRPTCRLRFAGPHSLVTTVFTDVRRNENGEKSKIYFIIMFIIILIYICVHVTSFRMVFLSCSTFSAYINPICCLSDHLPSYSSRQCWSFCFPFLFWPPALPTHDIISLSHFHCYRELGYYNVEVISLSPDDIEEIQLADGQKPKGEEAVKMKDRTSVEVYTHWSEWGRCSECESQGSRVKLGKITGGFFFGGGGSEEAFGLCLLYPIVELEHDCAAENMVALLWHLSHFRIKLSQ